MQPQTKSTDAAVQAPAKFQANAEFLGVKEKFFLTSSTYPSPTGSGIRMALLTPAISYCLRKNMFTKEIENKLPESFLQ